MGRSHPFALYYAKLSVTAIINSGIDISAEPATTIVR